MQWRKLTCLEPQERSLYHCAVPIEWQFSQFSPIPNKCLTWRWTQEEPSMWAAFTNDKVTKAPLLTLSIFPTTRWTQLFVADWQPLQCFRTMLDLRSVYPGSVCMSVFSTVCLCCLKGSDKYHNAFFKWAYQAEYDWYLTHRHKTLLCDENLDTDVFFCHKKDVFIAIIDIHEGLEVQNGTFHKTTHLLKGLLLIKQNPYIFKKFEAILCSSYAYNSIITSLASDKRVSKILFIQYNASQDKNPKVLWQTK